MAVVTQVLYDIGLASATGIGVGMALLVSPCSAHGILARRLGRLALPVAALVFATSVLHHLSAVAAFAKTGLVQALSWQAVSAFITAPPARGGWLGSGEIAVVQSFFYLLTIGGLLWVRWHPSRSAGIGVAGCAVLTAVVPQLISRTLTAHALPSVVLTIAHVVGALLWAGGLIVLATVAVMGRRPAGNSDVRENAAALTDEWRRLWERFSVVALYAVGALIISGTWMTWTHVGTPTQLLTTPYGRALGLKLICVALLMAAGAYNVRVLLPRIRAAQRDCDNRTAWRIAVEHFPVVVVGESVIVVAVFAIVPFLRGSARSEAGWPNAGPFDMNAAATGLVLVLLVALALRLGAKPRDSELM